MTVQDAQVRKLMEEMNKHGSVGMARDACRDRKTVRKCAAAGKLPSKLKQPRTWRTRKDPFEADWPWVREQLEKAPELEAKTLFEALQEKHPGRYQDGQLRTLQRRVKQWRAEDRPDRSIAPSEDGRTRTARWRQPFVSNAAAPPRKAVRERR